MRKSKLKTLRFYLVWKTKEGEWRTVDTTGFNKAQINEIIKSNPDGYTCFAKNEIDAVRQGQIYKTQNKEKGFSLLFKDGTIATGVLP